MLVGGVRGPVVKVTGPNVIVVLCFVTTVGVVVSGAIGVGGSVMISSEVVGVAGPPPPPGRM